MERKGLRARVKETTVEYFSTSSIHGTDYFFSDLSLPERLFWVIVVITMMVFSFILINKALVQWDDNPTITATDSVDSPIRNIQFPTVTICPDFLPDRFGFVRNVMNLMSFQCNSDEECANSQPLRNVSYSDVVDNAEYILNTTVNILLEHFNNRGSKNTGTEYLFSILYSQDYLSKIINHTASHADTYHELLRLLNLKLRGQRNNYGIFSYLNVDMNVTIPDHYFDIDMGINSDVFGRFVVDDYDASVLPNYYNYSDSVKSLGYLTYIILAMPLPGNFGTFYYNFNSLIYPSSFPVDWLYGLAPDYQQSYYASMFAGMLGGKDIGVSADEVAAILNPVPTYIAIQKYPRQFGTTVWLQQGTTEAERYANNNNTQKKRVPTVFSVPNYFGKLLGPHLPQVMEIMFHCQLRIRPIFRNRFLKVQDIYGGMDSYQTHLQSQLELTEEPFSPSWTDYRAFNKTPYTWFLNDENMDYYLMPFENDPNPQCQASYSGSDDTNFDALLEDLRAKYQYQQMITVCSGPAGNSTCEDKFQPTLTNDGICYAFNAKGFNDTFINNTYTNLFAKIYGANKSANDILNNENSGKSFQLFLLLDSHKYKVVDNMKGTFKIGINQILGFMNVRDDAVEADVGYVTKITITATQYAATDAFKKLDLNTRNCRFIQENPDSNSLFKFYSFEQCNFECRLRYSTQQCGCTPWNYPQYGNANITEICDGVQSYCFETKMDDGLNNNSSACDCLPNCEDIKFSVKTDKFKMSYNDECNLPANVPWGMSQQENDLSLIIAEKIRNMDGEEYLFWYNTLLQEANGSYFSHLIVENNRFARYMDPRITQDECRRRLENDFALVTIEVSASTVTTLHRDIAVDFVTKIGNIGGTLGLFTGMSILSFFEVAFFLYRLVVVTTKPVKRTKSKN